MATPSIITYQNLAAPTEIPPRAAVAAEQQHDASEHAHDPAQHASDAREEAAPIFPYLYLICIVCIYSTHDDFFSLSCAAQ